MSGLIGANGTDTANGRPLFSAGATSFEMQPWPGRTRRRPELHDRRRRRHHQTLHVPARRVRRRRRVPRDEQQRPPVAGRAVRPAQARQPPRSRRHRRRARHQALHRFRDTNRRRAVPEIHLQPHRGKSLRRREPWRLGGAGAALLHQRVDSGRRRPEHVFDAENRGRRQHRPLHLAGTAAGARAPAARSPRSSTPVPRTSRACARSHRAWISRSITAGCGGSRNRCSRCCSSLPPARCASVAGSSISAPASATGAGRSSC